MANTRARATGPTDRQQLLQMPLVSFFNVALMKEVEKKRGDSSYFCNALSRKGTTPAIIGILCGKPELLREMRQPTVADLIALTEKQAEKMPGSPASALKQYLEAFGLAFASELTPPDLTAILGLVQETRKAPVDS